MWACLWACGTAVSQEPARPPAQPGGGAAAPRADVEYLQLLSPQDVVQANLTAEAIGAFFKADVPGLLKAAEQLPDCHLLIDLRLSTRREDYRSAVLTPGRQDIDLAPLREILTKLQPPLTKAEPVFLRIVVRIGKGSGQDAQAFAQVRPAPTLLDQADMERLKARVAAMQAVQPSDEPAPSPEQVAEALVAARRSGGLAVRQVLPRLREVDAEKFPGTRAWSEEVVRALEGTDFEAGAVETWKPLDIDRLVSANPRFWQAYYEIRPGDPALVLVHAGLLQASGNLVRAAELIHLARQNPRVDADFRRFFDMLLGPNQRALRLAYAEIQPAMKLYDAKKFDEAEQAIRALGRRWPQFGLAAYELGLTMMTRDRAQQGRNDEAGQLIVDSDFKVRPEIVALFAFARRHDPFLWRAYQGEGPQVALALQAMVETAAPAMDEIRNAREATVSDERLTEFRGACQTANVHEMSLAATSVLVARRGSYSPEDFPFIRRSLTTLAQGPEVEVIFSRLADKTIEVLQFSPDAP